MVYAVGWVAHSNAGMGRAALLHFVGSSAQFFLRMHRQIETFEFPG